jgi:outer membrane protein assembly factor BamB
MTRLILCALGVLAGELARTSAADPGPWATYRGNPQRTGHTDGKPGPDKPAVLWAVASQDHFIAAPVPVGESLFTSAFGAFNKPAVALLPMADGKKPTWTRSTPTLKLASVSSPAVTDQFVLFGDGLHQDSGGVLHCLASDTGRPVWQLPLPGDLIHLEGGPTVADGRAYTGGGSAGVLCVDVDKLTLDGKDVTAAEVAKLQEERWKELQAKFEAAKKKDPDFAVPPSEDQLHKPEPKRVWQEGAKKWHVDAPVNVAGDVVIVCSGFLEKEKAGERAVAALDRKTGKEVWKEKLGLNPWGGATVAGDVVIVTGSTAGLYVEQVKGAKGEIAAFDLKTGQPKWRKDVPGGVTSCAAVADGLAVVTATDGKVRAYSVSDGERQWVYDAKAAMFAPPAVAGGVVYAADLAGAVHAVNLKDGTAKWKLDLGTDPATKAPGMVYGGVTVHGGKLFVGTCNLEGANRGKGTVMACIGGR